MKWGFINKSGEVIIDAQFDSALPFSEGLASVRCRSEHPDRACRDKCGYIDKSGNWVIKPQFGIASSFSEGLARVATGEEGMPGMYGDDKKEVWFTENGFQHVFQTTSFPEVQARFLTQQFLLCDSWGLPKVRVYYFLLKDHGF